MFKMRYLDTLTLKFLLSGLNCQSTKFPAWVRVTLLRCDLHFLKSKITHLFQSKLFRKSQKSRDIEGKCSDRDSQGQISHIFLFISIFKKTAQPHTTETTVNCAQIDAYSPLTLIHCDSLYYAVRIQNEHC